MNSTYIVIVHGIDYDVPVFTSQDQLEAIDAAESCEGLTAEIREEWGVGTSCMTQDSTLYAPVAVTVSEFDGGAFKNRKFVKSFESEFHPIEASSYREGDALQPEIQDVISLAPHIKEPAPIVRGASKYGLSMEKVAMVLLRHQCWFSWGQIGEVFDKSEVQVRNTIHRTTRHLRSVLRDVPPNPKDVETEPVEPPAFVAIGDLP